MRTIQPAADGQVPSGGAVTVSAVLVGRGADLASATLVVNGADSGAQIERTSARQWTIHSQQALAAGAHTARVLVQDATGASGGFTWRFVVGDPTPAGQPAEQDADRPREPPEPAPSGGVAPPPAPPPGPAPAPRPGAAPPARP